MEEVRAFVGVDVHKETISVAVADAGRAGEVRHIGTIENSPTVIGKLARSRHVSWDGDGDDARYMLHALPIEEAFAVEDTLELQSATRRVHHRERDPWRDNGRRSPFRAG